MRLRIKTVDGLVERISVPDGITLSELRQQIAGQFPRFAGDELKLSLNKQTEIEGSPQDTLRSAGICSGDNLWVTSAAVSNSPSAPAVLQTNLEPALQTSHSSANLAEASATGPQLGAQPAHTECEALAEQQAQDKLLQLHEAEDSSHASTSGRPDYLQRVLDSYTDPLQDLHQLMLLTMHSVLLETGMQLALQDNRYKLPAAAISRCSTSVCQLQYNLPEQQHKSVCEVKYICLGPALACIAATCNGSRLITLNIHLQQHFRQCDYKGITKQAISLYSNLQQLWTELKDGLALKLLASLQQAAGLSPQFGLLALPSELKLKILSYLKAKELCALQCCCTELKHTARSDPLWQELYLQEFGSPCNFSQRCQQAFQVEWMQRARDRRALEVYAGRRHRLPGPFPRHGGFAPPGPHGIINGGDYDRLPQPFLGGTPGMFGGALGGSGFGSQGPPPSLFLGGSRGSGRAARAAGNFRLS